MSAENPQDAQVELVKQFPYLRVMLTHIAAHGCTGVVTKDPIGEDESVSSFHITITGPDDKKAKLFEVLEKVSQELDAHTTIEGSTPPSPEPE